MDLEDENINALDREREFKLCDDAVKVTTSFDDIFGSIMQDKTRKESKRMVHVILNEYLDREESEHIMDIIEEYI